MKENIPTKKGIGEKIVKNLKRNVAIVAGAAALVGAPFGIKRMAESGREEAAKHETERKMYEKQGDAVVIAKHHKEIVSSIGVLHAGRSVIPTLKTQPEEWKITLRIGSKESSINISRADYERFKEGDSVPVKYDSRTMQVLSISNTKEGKE